MDNLNVLSLGAIIYGAILLLAVALIGNSIGSALTPFYAILALVLCYFQMTATLLGFNQLVLNVLFWLAFGASSIATVTLGYQLLTR